MPTKMFEKSLLNIEILSRELDVERILITEHRKEEIIHHILQSNGEFAKGKEKCIKWGRAAAHQMS